MDNQMDAADVLLLVFVVGLAAAAAWLLFLVNRHQNNLVNLVYDINNQVVDPLISTQNDVNSVQHDTARLKDQALSASSNIGVLEKRANDMDTAGVYLGKVIGLAGATANQSLWSQATTLTSQNVDLNLISHTSALGGVTVAKKFDVSGGYFAIDATTGSVKVCGPTGIAVGGSPATPLCTRFNTDVSGTTIIDGPAQFKNTVYAANGVVLNGSGASAFGLINDPTGVGSASGAFLAGPSTASQMLCGVDANQNVVIKRKGDNSAIVTVNNASGDVTISSPGTISLSSQSIKLSSTPTVLVGTAYKSVQLAP